MKARITALAIALTMAGASSAWASSITVVQNAGTTYSTSGVTDFSVDSSQMNGMQITAYWTVNGSAFTETKVWNSGVAFTGSNFNLAVSGDTYSDNAWQLGFDVSGTGLLQRLVFNGVPGNTVFDRTLANNGQGTTGSNVGKDVAGFDQYNSWNSGFCLTFLGCTQGNITATYFNRVALGVNPAVGDIYAGVQIDFLSFGGLGESDWQFSMDTDIASTRLVEVNQLGEVPEPASMVLLGTGLVGLAAAVRRRARR